MTKRWVAAGLLAGLVAMTACEDSPSDPAAGLPALDAALLAAQEAQGDVETMREPGVPGLRFPGLRFPSLDGDRPACPEEGKTFRCPPDDQDGVTVVHEVTFLDADGNPQEAFDETTTAEVVFNHALSGTGMPPRGRPGRGFRGEDAGIVPLESNVERQRSLIASGLAGDNEVVIWNGTSSGASTHSFEIDGTVWSRSTTSASQINDVVMPYPREEDSWPVSGTITQTVSFSGSGPEGDRQGEVDAVVTFNGTRYATVTVNGETIEIDLAERGRRGFGGHGEAR